MKNHTLLSFVLSAWLAAAISPAFAGEPRSFSLKEVRQYAVEHNARTRNARTDIEIARKKIWETTALGLPQVSGSVSYQNMLKIPITLIPARIFDPDAPADAFIEMQFGTQHNTTLNLTASQLIFQGSYFVALQASRVFLQISQNSLEKTEIEVKEAVTNSYYLVLLSRQTRDIIAANLANLKQNLYEVGEMHRVGFLEDTDVDQLQLTATDLENALRASERQMTITERLLKFQMGIDLEAGITLSDGLDAILAGLKGDDLLAAPFTLTDHIDFRIVDNQEKALSLSLKKEKSDFLPSVSAFFTHQASAMRNEFNFFRKTDDKWFPASIFGININVPIFSSGMRLARVGQAKRELEKVKRSKAELAAGLKLGLEQSRSEYASAIEKSANTQKNVDLAQKIYGKTLVKYKQGVATSLELSQTHTQLLTAQGNHIQAEIELLMARTKLAKALNRL